MPMEQDPGKGGTNADGTKSTVYCSYCYEGGKFRDNFTQASEMVAFVKEKLKEMGYGPLKRWFFTMQIPQLKRWKA